MKKINAVLIVLISGILIIGASPQLTHSQNSVKKIKPTESNVKNTKKPGKPDVSKSLPKNNSANPNARSIKKLSKSEVDNIISKNKKSYKRNLSGNWILQEDFESGNFPPNNWVPTNAPGQQWEEYNVSGYGIGNYCMFYSNWNCTYSYNIIFSPSFNTFTQSGDKLIFDYAYAPYNDGNNDYYDDLEILYFDETDQSWYSLVYYNGIDLQTSPGTGSYFVPNSSEWGTKMIDIPANASQLYFQPWENCSNNIYIDNIKVGMTIPSGNWVLQEDFETGIFPPAGWSVTPGSTQWEQYGVSSYGTGNYCMLYSNFNCNFSDNTIYTSTFSSHTQIGDKLIFDYAYTPNNDGFFYDDLEIFYYDSVNANWNSLIYYFGNELQTAPWTAGFFIPQSNEWGTKTIDIPANATQIYFKSIENCSNNLFIDNIRVGTPPVNSVEASVEKVWAKGKLPLVYGVPDKISALIKNNSVYAVSNLKVYLNISGANNLSDSLVIPNINAGDTAQVDFNGFMPVLNGFSTVTISVPDDNNNSNNSQNFISEANPNSIRYVDSNCCNGSVGWIGEYSFLNKYHMSGTGQIRKVNIKLSSEQNVGQIVYGYVVNSSGIVVGKSPHYKIQASDQHNTYKTFEITDPKPVIITNDYYYVGIAQTEYSGNGFAFTPQMFLYDLPARPDANYYANLAPTGSLVGVGEFPREYGQNYAIESVIGNQAAIDAGVSDLGLTYDQYFSVTSFTPAGRVFNAGTGSATFTVNRKITPGGYTSTKTVTSLAAGGNASVTFDPWTFTSGTTYTVRDSVILSGDGNIANNAMSNTITPRIAKQMCVLWQQQEDRDSLVRAINSDGRYANNFDTVRMNYTGSYKPWKFMFVNFKNESNYSPWVRDSLKAFLDQSTAGNKKSLIVFGNTLAVNNDPDINFFSNPADTIFYRQYLKSRSISDNWPANIPASGNKFRGTGFFSGVSQDSVSDPFTPELVKPVNGGTAAFKPRSVSGNGNDSCNAVCFSGTNYNTFFMTNKFSSLRSTNSSPLDGPVLVYTKIIDWLQSISTGAKILDLTVLPEGLYDPNANSMVRDTVTVYLRNAVSPFARVDSGKAYLSPSGQASLLFSNASNGVNYYIQVKHRNAMETWSKLPQMFSGNQLTYDFTTAITKAYGDNMKQSESRWVIYSGDVNKDGAIDASDLSDVDNDSYNSLSGYVVTDLTGDDFVDASDVSVCDNNVTIGVYRSAPAPTVFSGSEEDNLPSVNNSVLNEFKIDQEIYERTKNISRFSDPNFKREIKFVERKNNRVEYKTIK